MTADRLGTPNVAARVLVLATMRRARGSQDEHIRTDQIFGKLGLQESPQAHRRVLAVIRPLRA